MQKILTGSLLLTFLVSTSIFAEEQLKHRQGMQQMDSAAMKAMPDNDGQATQLTDGVVKKVDLKNGKITLQHGDIVNVMPAMTMSYRVKQVQQMESIHAGDKVRFALDKVNNNYVVTHIEVAK